jgi:hypothetical protein
MEKTTKKTTPLIEVYAQAHEERPPLTHTEGQRHAAFFRLTRPLTTQTIVLLFNGLTPGVQWNRCTSSQLTEAFARGAYGLGEMTPEQFQAHIVAYLATIYGPF